ncbi:MAG: hypothetical protein ACM3YE_14530 [Bacteroidota bacterium]
MNYQEFIAPYHRVNIGDFTVKRLDSLEIVSSRINPCDLARISLDCLEVNPEDFHKDDPVNVSLGYQEIGTWKVFDGFVQDPSKKRIIDLFCKDRMVRLGAKITKTFVNATPQEIISFGLRAAGIDQFILSSRYLNQRHLFVAKDITVIDLIKLVNRTWNLDDWAFYFEPEGTFYWGPWEESERYKRGALTVFEYGKNIINLDPSDEETGTLETILLPFLRHSTLIKIQDSRFWRRSVIARIERIRFRIEKTKTRSFIEWRIRPN